MPQNGVPFTGAPEILHPFLGVIAHRHVKDFFDLRQVAIDHFAFRGRATPWQMPSPASQ